MGIFEMGIFVPSLTPGVALIDWKFGLVLIESWKISVARQTTNHLLSWREELSVKTPLNHLDTDVQIRGAAKSRHKSKQ